MDDATIHRRRSIRLSGYDYASPGAYFVTLVCKDRELVFDDPLRRQIAAETWAWLLHFDGVELDEFVVMPNHLHGIIWLTEPRRGGSRTAPTASLPRSKPLGRIIGAYKTVSTKQVNLLRGTPAQVLWQRNYYERILRDETELNRVRQYIIDNPRHWDEDPENPGVKE